MDQLYVEEGYIDSGYFTYIADASANLNSNFTISVIPDSINGITNLLVTTSLSCTPTVNRSTQIHLDTIVTLNEQAVKITQSSSNLNVSASINAIPNGIFSAISQLPSNFDITANENTIRSNSAAFFAQFDLYDVGNIKTSGASLQFTSSSLSATPNVLRYESSHLTSQFNINSNSNITTSGIIHLNSIATININENRLRYESSHLTSQFSLYDVGNIKSSGSSLQFGTFTQQVIPNGIFDGVIPLNSYFTLFGSGSNPIYGEAHFNAYFTLYANGVIPLFQYVYIIPKEIREYKITQETREYRIGK